MLPKVSQATLIDIRRGASPPMMNDMPTSKTGRLRRLPAFVLRDLREKNKARKLAGLAPIEVKVRACNACGQSFESIGNRSCGCTGRVTMAFSGREIL
jgi:hypothetical protein